MSCLKESFGQRRVLVLRSVILIRKRDNAGHEKTTDTSNKLVIIGEVIYIVYNPIMYIIKFMYEFNQSLPFLWSKVSRAIRKPVAAQPTLCLTWS